MLISDNKKFIFIHVFKTGGKSITAALESFANPGLMCSHVSAFDVSQRIGVDKFNSYFSFVFVRNSWDWLVSIYYSRFKCPLKSKEVDALILNEKVRRLGSFSNFVKQVYKDRSFLPIPYLMGSQKDCICSPNGKLLINFVGKFENLEVDFNSVCSQIGVSTKLLQLNTSEHKPYQQEYNVETKEMVKQIFESDISYFNFKF